MAVVHSCCCHYSRNHILILFLCKTSIEKESNYFCNCTQAFTRRTPTNQIQALLFVVACALPRNDAVVKVHKSFWREMERFEEDYSFLADILSDDFLKFFCTKQEEANLTPTATILLDSRTAGVVNASEGPSPVLQQRVNTVAMKFGDFSKRIMMSTSQNQLKTVSCCVLCAHTIIFALCIISVFL